MNRDPRFALSQQPTAKQPLLDQLRALAAEEGDPTSNVETMNHESNLERTISNHTIGIVTAILVLAVLIQVILVKSWT